MDRESHVIDFGFDGLRATSWPVVLGAVGLDAVFLAMAMMVILPFFRSSFPVSRLTGGWIQPTLLFSLARYALVMVGVAMLLGGLGRRDMGLHWDKLKSGALVVFGLWIAMQLIGVLPGLLTTGRVEISPIWSPDKLTLIAGELVAQFLGNAFAEEVIFRGFLLTQVYLLLVGRISGRRDRIAAAILISQLIFSLSHIPQRIVSGYGSMGLLVNLVKLWVMGILFAVLYVRTGNIFIAIGVHALVNAPATILAMPSQAVAVLLPVALSVVLIVLWRPLTGWQDRMGAAQHV